MTTEEAIFQSHFGLILSLCRNVLHNVAPELSIPFWSDFISSHVILSPSLRRDFQSHFGLILSKDMIRVLIKDKVENFQSHFGLILSPFRLETLLLQVTSFNPILV